MAAALQREVTTLASRAQRSTQVVRCRPGTVTALRMWNGPGSAMHRYALHRVRGAN